MKKIRSLIVILLVSFLAIAAVGHVAAFDTSYYNVTVPRLGGSTSTNNMFRIYGTQAWEFSQQIGGDYSLVIRQEDVNNNSKSSWYRIYDTTGLYYNSSCTVGTQCHMRLKNDLLTYVNVQATGYWAPDTDLGD